MTDGWGETGMASQVEFSRAKQTRSVHWWAMLVENRSLTEGDHGLLRFLQFVMRMPILEYRSRKTALVLKWDVASLGLPGSWGCVRRSGGLAMCVGVQRSSFGKIF